MGRKLLNMPFKITHKTLRYLAFTKTTRATFGLEHTRMAHINLMVRHLRNLDHNKKTSNNITFSSGAQTWQAMNSQNLQVGLSGWMIDCGSGIVVAWMPFKNQRLLSPRCLQGDICNNFCRLFARLDFLWGDIKQLIRLIKT